MGQSIAVTLGNSRKLEAESVVIVPEKAIDEPGYIKALTIKDGASAKHEYHAMTQMAYFQYQDDELELEEVEQRMVISTSAEEMVLTEGMIIVRTIDGKLLTFVNVMQNKKKLLESGYRYCTRWVRLDI